MDLGLELLGAATGTDAARHFMPRSDNARESYFLVYRHSTVGGRFVKSLMIVRRPEKPADPWTFENTVSGDDRAYELKRGTHGLLVQLDTSYYALGVSARIETGLVSKRALVTLAIEAEALDLYSKEPIPALVMSVARENQPLVARAALLHLGSGATGAITHHDAQSADIASEAVHDDLIQTIEDLRRHGKPLNGRHVMRLIDRDGVIQAGEVSAMVSEIVLTIDNCAAWEADVSHGGKGSAANRGAIETYSVYGRPRD